MSSNPSNRTNGPNFFCPCCGYRGLGQNLYVRLHAPPFGELGKPPDIERFGVASLEGCHCCGYQFGYDDDPAASGSAISFAQHRQRWIERGCRWFCGPDPRPDNWSVTSQLAAAGIPDDDWMLEGSIRRLSLQRRWENIRSYLSDARRLLVTKNETQVSAEMIDHKKFSAAIDLFDHDLEHNELELALGELERMEIELPPMAEVQLRLLLAARCMKLDDRALKFDRRLRAGTDDQTVLGEIEASAQQELTEQSLGVTQQFFQVHQPASESVVQVCLRGEIGETWIGLHDEPFYWVVQSKKIAAGVWKAFWGYCSQCARVKLAIYSDDLSAEQITERLGYDPDEMAVKGSPVIARRPNSRTFGEHRWKLESPTPEFWDFEQRLDGLLIAIEPFAAELRKLEAQTGSTLCVHVALYDSVGWPCGYGLGKDTIARLAHAGLNLDFDLYHSGPNVPDEDS